jgi:hypothetical protein
LLGCLLTSEEARQAIAQYLRRIDMLPALEVKPVFAALMALGEEGAPFSIDALLARVDTRSQQIVSELSFSELGVREDGALQQALHCLEALERKALQLQSESMKVRIRELDREGRTAEALDLTAKLDELQRTSSGQNRVVL